MHKLWLVQNKHFTMGSQLRQHQFNTNRQYHINISVIILNNKLLLVKAHHMTCKIIPEALYTLKYFMRFAADKLV